MKRLLAAVLAEVFLTALFAGCGEKKLEPLRVCVDVDGIRSTEQTCENLMNGFLDTLALMGGPDDIELELVPEKGAARKNALTRIRTEMMSGKGPDVFIVQCGTMSDWEVLFPMPEKTMRSGAFLSLDTYIENAQYMEWEKLTPVVMAAGRDEYGQQLLPLTYTLPLTFYREADTGGRKPGVETTWEDMLADETGVLTTAATWFHVQEGEFHFYGVGDHYLEHALGAVADYDNEQLLFTEEELLQRTTEVLALRDAYDSGMYDNVPAHYQSPIHIGIDYPDTQITDRIHIEKGETYHLSRRGIQHAEKKTMVPIYADDGGTTASVTSFAAINANTKRAEDAFFVLDVLMDLEHQKSFDLYEYYLAGDRRGIPVHEDLLQESCPIGICYLTDDNYAEFVRVREQITHVRFEDALAGTMDEMFYACERTSRNDEDFSPIVSEYYGRMKQMMAE